ncbi:MAG: hypothetical protein Q4C13_05415 [Clostridia bacterium]|nr:hypothetical protein [Clostridia bacterium]
MRKTPPQARTQATPVSRLTEIQQTRRHTLTPSSEGGHAHEETSMTGFNADCPPAAEPEPVSAQAAGAGMPAFSWRPDAVLNGMIYAEILARPKALR